MVTSPRLVMAVVPCLALLARCGGDAATDRDAATADTDAAADTAVENEVADAADAAEVDAAPPGPWVSPPVAWVDCPGVTGWDCGDLVVPMDYADPEGPTLRERVWRHPASDAAARVGVLFVNPGGPGPEAHPFAQGLVSSEDELARRFDVVALDPRGTGDSEPHLDCQSDADLENLRMTSSELDPVGYAALVGWLRSSCGALGGDVLAAVGTERVARDLDALRGALGEERANLLGASYGTGLGATYARLFPDRVRAFVLDAPMTPRFPTFAAVVESLAAKEAELERFFRWCAATTTGALCLGVPGSGPEGAAKAWDDLVAALDSGDVPGPRGPATRDDLTTVAAALFASGSPDTQSEAAFNTLAVLMLRALDGDASDLVTLADLIDGRDEDGHYDGAQIANVAFLCRDGLAGETAAALADARAAAATSAPHFASGLAIYEACLGWAAPAERLDLAAPDAPPVLVLAGERDPSTPFDWAGELLEVLPEGSGFFTWHGAGHAFESRGAVMRRLLAFLVDPSLAAVAPDTCPVSLEARPTSVRGSLSGGTAATLELRDPVDDAVLVSVPNAQPGPFELALPEGFAGRWVALRITATGTLPQRRYLDLDAGQGALGTILTYRDADFATVFQRLGVTRSNDRLGLLDVRLTDCDGQGEAGAALTIDGAPATEVAFADGPRCALSLDPTAATLCGRAFTWDVPTGTHDVGWARGEVTAVGPRVVVETRGLVIVSGAGPATVE